MHRALSRLVTMAHNCVLYKYRVHIHEFTGTMFMYMYMYMYVCNSVTVMYLLDTLYVCIVV